MRLFTPEAAEAYPIKPMMLLGGLGFPRLDRLTIGPQVNNPVDDLLHYAMMPLRTA